MSRQGFFPAAQFPGQDQQNQQWDIEGSLVPQDTPEPGVKDSRPKDVQSNVPEVKPAPAQGISSVSATLPVATPVSTAQAAVMQQSTTSVVSSTAGASGGSSTSTGTGGVSPISSQEAIQLDAQRRVDHPSMPAVTTGKPAEALPSVKSDPMTASAPPAPDNTVTQMTTSPPPNTVSVMDSATDPNAVKGSI